MIELVGKIGSMALVNKEHDDIDYNKFARISRQLKPGMIWVSSGATEIGRLDYIKRNGKEICGDMDEIKTDYASQGQTILMQTYRDFVPSCYSLRQVLVEHNHFNNEKKRQHIKQLLLRSAEQNAIPIINYNDAVSMEENRKMEIRELLTQKGYAYELVDNDETASQIACLVEAKVLLILTSVDGIYSDLSDSNSLIREVSADTFDEVTKRLDEIKKACVGASRAGANGAFAKLEYIKPSIAKGTKVIIANAKYDIRDILNGNSISTQIFVKK